jgi:hypothetical protein
MSVSCSIEKKDGSFYGIKLFLFFASRHALNL